MRPISTKEIIACRCAHELRSGQVVNLGIGIPTLTANYLPQHLDVTFHTENGAFGFGARPSAVNSDSDFTNAGCEPITLKPGAAIMDLTTSLGAMRNGYIDVTILGALQVDALGNLANWACQRAGKWWPGIGGAMDLCYGTPKVIAALQHTNKDGTPKIRKRCTLPLTGKGCVKVIVTEHAVFDVLPEGLVLRELFPGLDVSYLRNITDAEFAVSPNLIEMSFDSGTDAVCGGKLFDDRFSANDPDFSNVSLLEDPKGGEPFRRC
jgi:3-oxoacid CoA-transferase subunit B/acetate CoA/acetoacetate CoA-transferase beta subunit